jgi:hypothetical protein
LEQLQLALEKEEFVSTIDQFKSKVETKQSFALNAIFVMNYNQGLHDRIVMLHTSAVDNDFDKVQKLF